MKATGTLKHLLARKAALEAAIAAEKINDQKRRHREDARLFSIVGEAIIAGASKNPETLGLMIRQVLAASEMKESDRTFIASKGF